MTPIPVTLATAGVLGIILIGLTVNVMRQRIATRVNLGDGAGEPGTEGLKIAIRAHANFGEYVPLALILLGGIEAAGAPALLIDALAIALIIARMLHPFGMHLPSPNPLRAAGAILTWIVVLIASITAIVMAV